MGIKHRKYNTVWITNFKNCQNCNRVKREELYFKVKYNKLDCFEKTYSFYQSNLISHSK